MTAQIDARVLVHTPAEQASEFVDWARQVAASPGIPWGLPAVDRIVIPMRPGNLVSVMGRPGHGKTSILAYLARREAKCIQAREAASREAVVYCTWEQASEEMEAFFQGDGRISITDVAWGRADVEEVVRRSTGRAGLPIWVIGHGIGRAGKRMPRMTPAIVHEAIESMEEDFGVKPTLVLFDYIQIVPIDRPADSRVQQVSEAVIRSKELALRIGCPIVVGVQASREVDSRKIKVPELADAQWCSAIEQNSDKVFSLWRPHLTEGRDCPPVRLDGREWPVTERLFVLQMLKQRMDRGRWMWVLSFAPQYLELCEMEQRFEEKLPYWAE